MSNNNMQELRDQLKIVNKALFGNPEDKTRNPGILTEMSLIFERLDTTNKILLELKSDLRRLGFVLLTCIISGICTLIFKR